MKSQELFAGFDPEQQAKHENYERLKQFWTPNRESYAGHTQLIVDSELRNAYETHHPSLPEYTAAAIMVFAEKELS